MCIWIRLLIQHIMQGDKIQQHDKNPAAILMENCLALLKQPLYIFDSIETVLPG